MEFLLSAREGEVLWGESLLFGAGEGEQRGRGGIGMACPHSMALSEAWVGDADGWVWVRKGVRMCKAKVQVRGMLSPAQGGTWRHFRDSLADPGLCTAGESLC